MRRGSEVISFLDAKREVQNGFQSCNEQSDLQISSRRKKDRDKDEECETGGEKEDDGMWKTQKTKTGMNQELCAVSW